MPATPQSHPERFDPRAGAGRLIDAEHRGRYWWAAQAAAGKDTLDAGCGVGYGLAILAEAGAVTTTGVDVDVEAIEQAGTRLEDSSATELLRADLRELPIPDDSFDLIVCFEVIEHMEEAERALGELQRVLRPDGLLLISSPNPDAYPSGNEHHVHEYRPQELADLIGERFANQRAYRQHPWLASAIEPASQDSSGKSPRQTRALKKLDPGAETYSILAASDAELAELDGLLVLGEDFEVGWWAQQVQSAEQERDRAEGRAEEKTAQAQREADERMAAAKHFEQEARRRIEVATSKAREQVEAQKEQANERIEVAKRDAKERIEAVKSDAKERIARSETRALEEIEATEQRTRELLAQKDDELRLVRTQAAEREEEAKERCAALQAQVDILRS